MDARILAFGLSLVGVFEAFSVISTIMHLSEMKSPLTVKTNESRPDDCALEIWQ
uniref:Uncharacterized protein n=1 Tax=Agrobacterium tumefaciens TaxID=358 RepID=K7XK21_AGRTU|nr:Hypothetical protein [Agrobacterium radiobacter]